MPRRSPSNPSNHSPVPLTPETVGTTETLAVTTKPAVNTDVDLVESAVPANVQTALTQLGMVKAAWLRYFGDEEGKIESG